MLLLTTCAVLLRACVDAGVARALRAEPRAIDLPNAAAGDWRVLKVVEQVLHARIERLPDRPPREAQRVRRRLRGSYANDAARWVFSGKFWVLGVQSLGLRV